MSQNTRLRAVLAVLLSGLAVRSPAQSLVAAKASVAPPSAFVAAAPMAAPAAPAFFGSAPVLAPAPAALAAAPAAAIAVSAVPAAPVAAPFAAGPAARASLDAAVAPAKSAAEKADKLDQVFTGRAAVADAPASPVDELSSVDFVKTLPDGQVVKIQVAGRSTLMPPARIAGEPIVDPVLHDVVIVGGGLAGLSSAWHLRDMDAVVLEREDEVGGMSLEIKSRASGVRFGRAAYYTEPTDEVKQIYEDVGMTAIDKTAIKEPIDSYFYKGQLIKDVWSPESLKKLPEGFTRFLKELHRLDDDYYFDFDMPVDIPEKAKYLDKMTIKEFLKPYGPELTEFLDSYCQSAFGGHADQISALAFFNFYADEVITRYTWPGGNGGASKIIAQKLLAANPGLFRTGSWVREVVNVPGGVQVTYERGGRVYVVKARQAVVASPLKVAAKIVPEMPAAKRALIGAIQYADYVVHTVFSKKEHFTEGYDTWFPSGQLSFTDVITARWSETEGFTKPHAGPGVLNIYMPKAPPQAPTDLSPLQTAEDAAKAVQELRELIPGLAEEKELAVYSDRLVDSIHLTGPGYLTGPAVKMAAADGNIQYANNNLGLPSFEIALVSGKRAAERIRAALGFLPLASVPAAEPAAAFR